MSFTKFAHFFHNDQGESLGRNADMEQRLHNRRELLIARHVGEAGGEDKFANVLTQGMIEEAFALLVGGMLL